MENDGADDLPNAPDPVEFTTERGADVTITANMARMQKQLTVTVEGGAVEFDEARARLDRAKGTDVVNCGRQKTKDGDTVKAMIPVGEHKDGIESLKEAAEKRHEAEKAAEKKRRKAKKKAQAEKERNRPLKLTIRDIQNDLKTPDATYRRTTRVLIANNRQSFWADDRKTMKALERVCGEAKGHIKADTEAFEEFEEGDTLSPDEAAALVDGIDDARKEMAAEKEAKAAREEMEAEYPELRGTGVDPQEVHAAADEAKETGEPVAVTSKTTSCSDPREECDLDIISYSMTPDGDIETSQTHTW